MIYIYIKINKTNKKRMHNETIFMRLVTTSKLPKLINLFNIYVFIGTSLFAFDSFSRESATSTVTNTGLFIHGEGLSLTNGS